MKIWRPVNINISQHQHLWTFCFWLVLFVDELLRLAWHSSQFCDMIIFYSWIDLGLLSWHSRSKWSQADKHQFKIFHHHVYNQSMPSISDFCQLTEVVSLLLRPRCRSWIMQFHFQHQMIPRFDHFLVLFHPFLIFQMLAFRRFWVFLQVLLFSSPSACLFYSQPVFLPVHLFRPASLDDS